MNLRLGLHLRVGQDLLLLGLGLLHQLGGHLLGRQQRLAHGLLGGTVLLYLLGQHLQLGLQRDILLEQGGVVLRQRVQKLIHRRHIVSTAAE